MVTPSADYTADKGTARMFSLTYTLQTRSDIQERGNPRSRGNISMRCTVRYYLILILNVRMTTICVYHVTLLILS